MVKEVPISEINEDIYFHNVYGMCQKWRNKKNSFSYMTMPRPYHGFMYILCDRVVITLKNGEKQTFENGNLVYIPKGIYYFAEFYGNRGEYDSLLVNFLMEDKDGELVFYKNITKLVGTASAKYTDDFHKIICNYAGTVNDRFSIMAAFYNLLDNLAKHHEKKMIDNEYNIIAPAIMYMDSHVNENTSVPELAKMCLVSETCFRKYFKMCTGISPSNYKIKSKIEKAMQMLKTDTISTSEIVSELNFYDMAYFYKMFKKETGLTPAEYIKRTKDRK